MKYILVTGGVISGIGKGVIASSIGTILRCHGLKVTSIKIDPYINIDAGTFSPYEHGEVFVLDDGGEVDLDLGNYERFLDVTLKSDNNITTGKIYLDVITKERKGEYLGKTVQVVPHITDAIQNWVERVSKIPVDETNTSPEVCIIELGGTIGDIESMPFVEAFNQLQFKVKQENFCVVHVSLIPQLSSGQQKTKPTQHSVREMRGLGLIPDFIVARCVENLPHSIVNKISNFCNIPLKQILVLPDICNTYQVPLIIEDQNFTHLLFTRLGISHQDYPLNLRFYNKWKNMTKKYENIMDKVKIVLVGKYTQFDDSYTSVIRALQHASITAGYTVEVEFVESLKLEQSFKASNLLEYEKAWEVVKSSHGILVPGGFGERGIDGKILAIEWARTNCTPFLGICLGMQLALVEMARDVLGLGKATSAEFRREHDSLNKGAPIIIQEMPEFNPDVKGGTMRLGKRSTLFKTSPKVLSDTGEPYQSIVRKLYGNLDRIDERHRHRFEFNTEYKEALEKCGLHFVGEDDKGERMEIIELEGHPFFVGTQFHPEYKTRPLKPSPVYYGFVLASIGILDTVLSADRNALTKAPLGNGNQFFMDKSGGTSSNENGLFRKNSGERHNNESKPHTDITTAALNLGELHSTTATNGSACNSFALHPEVIFSKSGMFSPEKLNTLTLGATTFAN